MLPGAGQGSPTCGSHRWTAVLSTGKCSRPHSVTSPSGEIFVSGASRMAPGSIAGGFRVQFEPRSSGTIP